MAYALDSTLTPSASPPTGNFRDRLAEAIERLIAVLDALDGDCDLEGSPAVLEDGTVVCIDIDCEREPDLEHDDAERGIADGAGMWEQYGISLGLHGFDIRPNWRAVR